MKKSTKIWLCVAGVLLIALGVVCILKPAATLLSAAWLLGLFTLMAGIFKMVFTIDTQAFLPNSGTRMLGALLDIMIGCFFLFNLLGTAISLPIVFALWVFIQGIIIAVESFDYKKVGFGGWWFLFILGICGAVLGFFGLRNPEATGKVLSTLIGLGIIANGCAHLIAVAGINRFEKLIKNVTD